MTKTWFSPKIIVWRDVIDKLLYGNYNSHPYAGISQIRFIGLDFSSQHIFNELKYALR
jgi:hypothetical protein